jgi:hypothetical protein
MYGPTKIKTITSHIFHEELEHQFPKYHVKISLQYFNANWGDKILSNQQPGMRVYVKSSNNNVLRVAKFATPKNCIFKSKIYPHL